MALLRQMQPLVPIMALGIGLGLIGNSFGIIPTSGSALFGFAATILAGATMGLIGGGGSILTVPILVYLLEIPPVLATGYSLFVVGLSALVGSVNYFKLGLVNLKAGKQKAPHHCQSDQQQLEGGRRMRPGETRKPDENHLHHHQPQNIEIKTGLNYR